MAFKFGTICSKHDEIKDLAEKISDMAEKCLEDGQRMEAGLVEKRKRIDRLEAENEDLQSQLERAEKLIESLQEENRDLAAQLKLAEAQEGGA